MLCGAHNVNEHVMQKGAVLKLHFKGLQTPCTNRLFICQDENEYKPEDESFVRSG